MKVIDCDCGETLQAANEDDLAAQVLEHSEDRHPDLELSAVQARQLVSDRAYEASDS